MKGGKTKTLDGEGQEWTSHIEELRKRIIAVLGAFFAAAFMALVFSSRIAAFLTAPLTDYNVKLHTFAPAEKFMAYLHLSAWTGLICTAPFLCMQAALFLRPGLRARESRYVNGALFIVPVLFALGAAACYRFLAPHVFGFFLSFGEGDGVQPLWGLSGYLAFLFDLMLAAGILFQLPLVLLVLLISGAVSPKLVAHYRPHCILMIFFLAAALTPPDVVSQVMLGIPLYLLFEGALALGKALQKKKS
jgi:sec-independent protein translocase protein TatC